MKKLFKAFGIALLGVCMGFGFVACDKNGGDNSQGSSIEQVKDAPVIRNKPTDNTLTITPTTNTYQFETEAYDGKITWISTVGKVATISENGLLTMLGAGYTEVIAKDAVTGLSDSVVLTIVDGRITEMLTITGMPETVRVGDAAIWLGATSSEGGEVSVTFTSSNPSVATVSDTGLFTPIAKGKTTITATKVGTNLKATLLVQVLGSEIETISIVNFPKYGMLVGNTYALSASCQPGGCEDYEIEWSVDNTKIAVLDGLNNLIAISKGECTVTATVKGTDIKTSKTVQVGELSATKEDFRFATVGTSNVMNVGPTITFNNVDGEIVEYGENQALKITTRANNAYNAVVISFGELEAGTYKLSMMFKVEEGRHSGAMVMDSDSAEFGYVMAATALGNDEYEFYFTQTADGPKKIAISAQQWMMEGSVILDNLSVEQVDGVPTAPAAGTIGDGTFNNLDAINGQNCNIDGVYVAPRKLATELVDDSHGGKALKVTRVEGGYAWIAMSLGSITPGNYTLTLDIENYDYQAILQVSQMFNENGLWKHKVIQDIKYGDADTIFEQATVDGKTYTLHFSVSQSYDNFALSLSANLAENASESIIIDNVKLEKTNVAQTFDFETEKLMVVSAFNGAGIVDFGKAHIVTSSAITDQGYVTEGGNTYYKVTFKGWNTCSLINLGTLPAGHYSISMDAKLLRGSMLGRFVTVINGVSTDLVENVDYTKTGDTYTFLVQLTKTESEFCIGYRSVSNNNADFTLAYDNISILEYIAPTSVEITESTEMLMKGESFDFKASVTPAECTSAKLVWSVNNTAVGEIDDNGKFMAKTAGKCTVTVAVAGTALTASTTLTVKVDESLLPPDEGGEEKTTLDEYGVWMEDVING